MPWLDPARLNESDEDRELRHDGPHTTTGGHLGQARQQADPRQERLVEIQLSVHGPGGDGGGGR